MKTIATKSRLAITLLCIGAVFSILIGVAIGVNKPDGWQVCIVVSVIFFGATIFGIIYELLQPQVLIKADDKNLYVYHKRRWKTMPAKNNTNPAKTPIFTRFFANSRL